MRKINRSGIDFFVVDNTKNAFFWDIDYWESENYDTIKKMSLSHDVFVHAGGWIGPFTLFASKLYRQVYCLEPDPNAFDELQKNIECNNFRNIFLDNKAFLNQEKEIIMGSNVPLGGSVTNIFQENNGIVVNTITLKNYFTKNNIPKNSFLMLDVEGAEYLLFDDIRFFEEFTPTILVSYHLTFLTDDNFNYLVESLKKLEKIYNIDVDELMELRKTLLYGDSFVELNYLYTLK